MARVMIVSTLRSADGTVIAFELSGTGPALILVDEAGHYRDLGPHRALARLLTDRFTVLTYDRRGRGDSTDTPPYAVEREVDDLAGLIAAAGGQAYVFGACTGALLAMHAAARGLAIPKLALRDPPVGVAGGRALADLTTELAELVAADHRPEAVQRFHAALGIPATLIARMRHQPSWAALEAIAHTFVYDCMIAEATSPGLPGSVRAPTLVIDGGDAGRAAAVARALPGGIRRSLADGELAPALTEFFLGRSFTESH
jgi:pimeloyl-ACP methyl ester carboxylesterase